MVHHLTYYAHHDPAWLDRQPRHRVYRLHSRLREQVERDRKALSRE